MWTGLDPYTYSRTWPNHIQLRSVSTNAKQDQVHTEKNHYITSHKVS